MSDITPTTVRSIEREALLVAETSEGAQEMFRREQTGADELRRELGAVLKVDGRALDPNNIDVERDDDETMIINMGPSHPSTHGVLRIMLELDGETVLRSKPVIGYLHTGMEKTGEELSYVQGGTNVTRYQNPEVDALFEQGRHELDPKRRQALYRQINTLIQQDHPILLDIELSFLDSESFLLYLQSALLRQRGHLLRKHLQL